MFSPTLYFPFLLFSFLAILLFCYFAILLFCWVLFVLFFSWFGADSLWVVLGLLSPRSSIHLLLFSVASVNAAVMFSDLSS